MQVNQMKVFQAARSGDIKLLAEAVSREESLCAVDASGMSPIHLSIMNHQNVMLKILQEFGANIDQQDATTDCHTPLHCAIKVQNFEAFKFLMNCGANPNIANAHGQTALQFAESTHWQKAVEYCKKRQSQIKDLITFGSVSVSGRSYTINAKHGPIQIGQVDVLDQFSAKGCGSASCGYQALKNAIGITSLAKGIDWHHWLSDPEHAATLFVPKSNTREPGMWRANVIRYRQKRVLSCAIEESIMPYDACPGGDCTDQLRPAYNEIYRSLLSEYAGVVAQEVLSGKSVKITLDSLVEWIQKQSYEHIVELTQYQEVAGRGLADRIKDRGFIAVYFHLADDFVRIFSADMLEALIKERKTKTTVTGVGAKSIVGEQLSLDGEWACENELIFLYDSFKQKHSHLINSSLVTVDAQEEKLKNGDLEKAADAIKKRIAAQRPLKQDVYPFVLNVGGHWVTVVLDTCQDGIRRYTLANSSSNKQELYGGRLIDFIGKLESCKKLSKLLPGEQTECWHGSSNSPTASSQSEFSFDSINEELESQEHVESDAYMEAKKVFTTRLTQVCLSLKLLEYLMPLSDHISQHVQRVFDLFVQQEFFDAQRICNNGFSRYQCLLVNNNESLREIGNLKESLYTPSNFYFAIDSFSDHDYERARQGDKNLAFARLAGADLSHVDLSNANLFGANLRGAQLSKTNLNNAKLFFTDMRDSTMSDCKFSGIKCFEAKFDSCQLANVTFKNAAFYSSDFHDATMANVKFKKSKIMFLFGKNCQMSDCFFESNVIMGWVPENLNANNLRFVSNILQNVSFKHSTINNVAFTQNLLYNFKCTHSNLSQININKSYVIGAKFAHSHIDHFSVVQSPAITGRALIRTLPQDEQPGGQRQNMFENLKIIYVGAFDFKNATLATVTFIAPSAESLRGQHIATPSDLGNWAQALFYNWLPSKFSWSEAILPKSWQSSPERNLLADMVYSLPISIMQANFYQADLSAVYLKYVSVSGTDENSFVLSAARNTCILEDCFIPGDADALRAAGMLVNGKINPEFEGLYSSPQVQESFLAMGARVAVQVGVSKGVGMLVESVCSLQ